ncbi:BrnT family toxin [Devosia psychrophila]|uniref:BrnT family toxin n=1 Tax=Devosia psychrophila TaxID=728005 RepID=UPI0018F3D4AA
MEFEWDEAKRHANFNKHDVDVFVAALIFERRTISTEDRRHDYGEVRHKSIGMVDDVCYVVIHTERSGIIRAHFCLRRRSP